MADGLHVVPAAGGTAGHVEPDLNLADELRTQDPSIAVTVIGGDRGLESVLVPARGYPLRTVPAVPLPRRPSLDLLALPPRLLGAVRRAAAILDEVDAGIVVGFGGYAAMPTYLAARRRGIPLAVHEANARAGVANRVATRLTPHRYEAVAGSLPGAQVVGMPLRPAIASLDRAALRAQARAALGLPASGPVLLAFGGSQGARSLNDALAGAMPALVAAGISVLHAHGPRNAPVSDLPGYVPVAYVERLDLAYAAADLALCRAGAMTCAELAAVGLPAVYVPLPIGNGEQRLNALPVVQAGGGLIVDDADLTAEWLAREVPALLHDGGRIAAMGEAAKAHGVRDGAARLAAHVLAIARRSRA